MKGEIKLCPQNFQVWVAFLMGMVVIVIAIVVFDTVSNNRLGADNRVSTEDVVDHRAGLPDEIDVQSGTVLTSGGTDSSVWLGIEVNNITEEMAQQLGLNISDGVFVSRVLADSPARNAGVLPGDILFEFDHRDVDDVEKLIKLLDRADPDERVKLSLIRNDDRIVIYVELEQSPEATIAGQTGQNLYVNKAAGTTPLSTSAASVSLPDDQRWGLVLSELTDPLRKLYQVPENEEGVLVMMVGTRRRSYSTVTSICKTVPGSA